MYSNAEQREKMLQAERKWVDDRVQVRTRAARATRATLEATRAESRRRASRSARAPTRECAPTLTAVPSVRSRARVCPRHAALRPALRAQLILKLKKEVCTAGQDFVVVNQKGIDPLALDLLQKHGILALRRAKKRNMERLTLACGGSAINSFEEMNADVLGYADSVYEQQLGEDAFTFIEGTKHPMSCTILLKGPHKHTIDQMKDAVRDGLRAVRNAVEDGQMVPGAGAFELLAHNDLMAFKKSVQGRAKLGVQAYADALLVIPRTLAENAGYDANDTLIKLQEASAEGKVVGVDLDTGEPIDPVSIGVWDNWRVKRQMLDSSAVIAEQLLLVDEIIRAGKQIKKAGPGADQAYQG